MANYKAAQVVFCICNVLLLIMGAGMITVGCWMTIARSDFVDLMTNDQFRVATSLMISSGVIVIIVSLLGCMGVWMGNQCMIGIYFICILIILAMELAAGIIAYIFRDQIDEKLRGYMLEGLQDETNRVAWDNIQTEYQCCGVNNYTDWYGIADTDNRLIIPDSCCNGPRCGDQGAKTAHYQTCYDKAVDLLKENFYIIGVVGIVLGCVQVILLVASLFLLITLRQEKRV